MGGGTSCSAYVEVGDNFEKLFLCFHHMGLRDKIQVNRLGSEHLYLLSFITNPNFVLFFQTLYTVNINISELLPVSHMSLTHYLRSRKI